MVSWIRVGGVACKSTGRDSKVTGPVSPPASRDPARLPPNRRPDHAHFFEDTRFDMMESMKRLVIASIPLLFLAAAEAQDLADGPGKDTFVKICSACHDAAVVVTMHNSKDDWQATVDDMKGRGAEGSDDEFKAIIGYLAKYQGPEVNVNKATAKDLETQLEITTSEATAIVKYRQDKGDFKEWADLQKVADLDIKKIEPLKGRITF